MSITEGPIKTIPTLSALLALGALAFFVVLCGSASALPSDRSYEMVSPPDKNDGDVGAGGLVGSYLASRSGDRLAYTALGGFAGASANMTTGGYLAERGTTSWASHPTLLPSFPPSGILVGYGTYAVSADFTKVITATNVDLNTDAEIPDPNGLGGVLYRYDPVTREAERVTPPATDGAAYGMPTPANIGGSSDFSRVFYVASAPLTQEAEAVATGRRVYMWQNGHVTLQSKLPNGDPTNGSLASGATYGDSVVVADGDVLYFIGAVTGDSGPLYRRDLSGELPVTELVNVDENDTETVPLGNASYQGGSVDGKIAFFISDQPLVDADTDMARDLYRYDHSQPVGSRLGLISVDSEPGDADSPVDGTEQGVSRDGKTVYFRSHSQLVAGEPTGAGTKLYSWSEDDGLSYVTTAVADFFMLTLSGDGRYIAFLSASSGITAEDNGGFSQVYLHDSQTGDITCVSCRPDGAANTAVARLRQTVNPTPMFAAAGFRRRNVSNNGEVFFESAEPLLSQDTNGKFDVYGWKKDRGLELYSTGRSDDDSEFLDASVDGKNVFILTREQLSAWDWDHHLDAYAVRVGDGLPEPPDPVPPCTGDDCQGPPPLPPALPDPASSNLSGPGNREQSSSADCTKPERKAKRLERKAKRLKQKAKRASGKKAKRLKRKAKTAKRKSKHASRRVARCNAGGNS